ncbi:MAG TPA: TonB-dependent receptor [Flavilitoribacter sp.]|nr:TonB-dependent receptor [Flavilitoribacter sp.]
MKKQLSLLIQLVLFSAFLSAQGEIEVTLGDLLTQEPIAGYTVSIENPAIGFQAAGQTDANGKLRFKGLALNGIYRIFTPGDDRYDSAEAAGIELRSNYIRSVNLLLPQKTSQQIDEVVVRATSTSRINAINAEVASEMPLKQIEELPVEGRDITRMLYRLPNVSQATGFYPEAPNVSINGANGLFNNYLIDGMDNNERFLGGQKFAMPVGFTRNVTVLTNNYSVEFGNTGNGIINVTTRSGSNDFKGEAFFLTRPGSVIDAESPYLQRDLSGNQVKDGFQRYQAGVGFGGPITRDKTFYYINLEHTTDLKDNLLNSPVLGVNETVRGNNRFTYASAKIDHIWNTGLRSSLRANLGGVTIGRQAGGLTGGLNFPSAANFQDRNSLLIANSNVYFTEHFSSETNLQYARFRWNYGRAENPDSPDVTVLDNTGQVAAFLGHPGYLFDETENTFQVQQKFSFYLGKHTLKTGVELISAKQSLLGGGNPNGSYTVRLTDSQLNAVKSLNRGSDLSINDIPADAQVLGYFIELRPAAFGATQNIFSAYLEDQIAATDRLNLSLGLRYDYDNLSKGGSDKGDLNNIAPRVSFNYKLDERSALRGGFGLFYDKINYAIYSDALQQNNSSADFKTQIAYLASQGILPADTDIDRVTFNGNLTVGQGSNTGLPFTYLNGPAASSYADQRNLFSGERRILNPNGYQNPYTYQSTLGYQYQVNENKLFYVDFVYNESRNLFRTVNLNAPSAWDYGRSADELVARSSAWANLTRPVPIIGGGGVINGDTLTGVAQSIVMTETAGKSRYYAMSLNLQKDRGDDDFSYRLIYTLSLLENNTEDINFRAMDANNFDAEWGPSINDRRHIINGMFSWYPAQHFNLTLAALLQSGQPINRVPDGSLYRVINADGTPVKDGNGNFVYTNDLNGDGSAFGDAYVGNSDRHPGESRNSDRLPWSNTFDLSAQYQFSIGGGMLEIRADVFNLFNAENLSGYSNNATQSNQIQTGPASGGLLVRRNAAPPRQFQFGVRYLF